MATEHVNALRIGAVVEEFRIERMLGHGGFGITYLARDLHLNNLVAMKEYLPQEFAVRAANSTIVPKSTNDGQAYEWGLDRFKQEARALARFKHPNIVRASRLIEANGTAYLVMDYEIGMTLGEYLKKHGPTLDEARLLGVFLPILDGLYALHRAELIHRDIKPGNIYVRSDGGPMLIDFGAVRQAVGAHSRSLTAVVTPGYAPIEQYSSEGKQGPWTDLYAVGATMYTCVLGRSPVDAARRSAAISDGDPDPLVSAARVGKGKYSDELLAAIDWAMQFRTRDRPQTAFEFKERLKRAKVAPLALELDVEDEDRTAMGAARGGSVWSTTAAPEQSKPASRPTSAPVSKPASKPLSQPLPKSLIAEAGGGDADVASAPMEWFDAPAEPAPAAPPQEPGPPPRAAASDPDPLATSNAGLIAAAAARPSGHPTGPEDDPLNQTAAGLILGAAVGARPSELEEPPEPRARAQPKASPAPPARSVAKPAAKAAPAKPAPPPVPPATGKKRGLIAEAAAGRRPSQIGAAPPPPSSSNRGLRAFVVLLVLGALGASAWWVATGEQRRDRKLWVAATRSDTLAGYESYLAACTLCQQKDAAERAIERQKAKLAAAAASDAKLQQVATLKARFAQHLIAGEIDAPVGANATTTLDELAALAPTDLFVISGREQLALRRAERVPEAKPKAASVEKAAAPVEKAAAPAEKPAAPITLGAAAVAGKAASKPSSKPPTTAAASKPAAAAPKRAAEPVAPGSTIKPGPGATAAATPAPAPAQNSVDKATLLFDLVAKFELAMAQGDYEGPGSAKAHLLALEALAPEDPIVKDVRRRYDGSLRERKAKEAAAKPAPSVLPQAAPVLPAAATVLPSAKPEPARAEPAPAAPARVLPAAAPPPPGTAIVDSLGPHGAAPTVIALAGGSARIGDLAGGGNPDEQPIVTLKLAPYAIGRAEVTRGQFRAFADATKYVTEAERSGGCRVGKDGAWAVDAGSSWRKLPFAQSDEDPVVCVTPGDALAYTAWLSKQTGHRYRLPTEAEWEHAARGGTQSGWWWGDAAGAGQANCDGCAGKTQLRTLPTGQFAKNGSGLVDVVGNAWEWTCSAYTRRLAIDSVCSAPRPDLQMVMRGGSWATPPERARSSTRGYAVGGFASDNAGFRVLREF